MPNISNGKEKILLAIVDFKLRDGWPLDQTRFEMIELVKACGGEVVETIMCPAHPPTSATLIHKGKVEEIADCKAAMINRGKFRIFNRRSAIGNRHLAHRNHAGHFRHALAEGIVKLQAP